MQLYPYYSHASDLDHKKWSAKFTWAQIQSKILYKPGIAENNTLMLTPLNAQIGNIYIYSYKTQ